MPNAEVHVSVCKSERKFSSTRVSARTTCPIDLDTLSHQKVPTIVGSPALEPSLSISSGRDGGCVFCGTLEGEPGGAKKKSAPESPIPERSISAALPELLADTIDPRPEVVNGTGEVKFIARAG